MGLSVSGQSKLASLLEEDNPAAYRSLPGLVDICGESEAQGGAGGQGPFLLGGVIFPDIDVDDKVFRSRNFLGPEVSRWI